ncbi:MAG TPA: hypothetical protein VMT53_08035 [Terriglobales bacterium]|nr:hypothetical protein [Terriglobales bacterium]
MQAAWGSTSAAEGALVSDGHAGPCSAQSLWLMNLSPYRGLVALQFTPTAYAVGYILAPLPGYPGHSQSRIHSSLLNQ